MSGAGRDSRPQWALSDVSATEVRPEQRNFTIDEGARHALVVISVCLVHLSIFLFGALFLSHSLVGFERHKARGTHLHATIHSLLGPHNPGLQLLPCLPSTVPHSDSSPWRV